MRIQRRGEDTHDWELYNGEGSVGVEWYFRQTTALQSSVMLYHLEPGAEEGEHLHDADDPASCSPGRSSEELYLVISGEVVMTVGGERTVLRAGDAAYAATGERHGVRNESDAPAELVLVFGPPRDSAGDPEPPQQHD
jgi:mannose-6-phosphate isomerase-like protein (cupin superfamily)